VSSFQKKAAIVQRGVTRQLSEPLGRLNNEIDFDRALSYYGLDRESLGWKWQHYILLSEVATAKSLATMAMASLEEKKQVRR